MHDADSTRQRLLARLDMLAGDWTEQVDLPGTPAGRVSFQWTLDGQFLLQRSEIPEPDFPDSLAIIAVAADTSGYTQHYFDSRGVVRSYAMTLDEHTWTLLRDQPDFTPLNFSQRFTGTFDANGTSITASWESSDDGEHWRKDFDLTYTRRPDTSGQAGGHERTDSP